LIMVEGAAVDYPIGVVGWPRLGIQDDKFIPTYKKLTDLIHSFGAKTFLEVQHTGPSHPKAMAGLQPVAPSALTKEELPVRIFDPPRELTIPEIKDIQLKFVNSTERAWKSGFDGVDLHGAHRYLINAFLSRAWNKRQDEYGCRDLNTRARFTIEIIQGIKERLPNDFVVGIRINVAEWGLKDGITLEDSIAFSKMFQEAGADFIDVSGYGYGKFMWTYWGEQLRAVEQVPEVTPWLKTIDEPGFIISQAQEIKKMVSIPVISGGRIDPRVADQDIKEGRIDLAFFARRLIADPSFPIKAAEGRWEDIAPCTGCLECWDSTTTQHRSVQCRINAACGREHEYEIKPAKKKKKVLVVGGGPAGMEAARVAALRGHETWLYEKENSLGGLLRLAEMIKGPDVEDLSSVISYLKTQMTKAGVQIRLGQEVNLSLIQNIKPDVVILALGGIPTTPDIPGITNKKVLSGTKLRRQSAPFLRTFGVKFMRWASKKWMPMGKQVVIIGGAIQGCQLAEFLVERGRKVTIVESSNKFGNDMVAILAVRLIGRLEKQGVTMIGEAKCKEITDQGLVITTKDGQTRTLAADNILIALPYSPNTSLQKSLEGIVPEVHSVGDCREPLRIIHAIRDGSRVGHAI
jgi:2,4-dienoyl-CoA reductase (NADPH2)